MPKSSKSLISHIPAYLEYLEIEKGLAQLSVKNYDRFLSRFKSWLTETHQNLKPHELDADTVWKYRLYLSHTQANRKFDDTLKKSTQNYYLIALRGFLTYLIDKDIETLPPDKIKLAKQNDKERSVKFLSLKELERLLLTPDTSILQGLRDRAIMETLFSTGLRISELTSLNREQFNPNIIRSVDELELSIKGKGARVRTVYFSKRCLGWILAYLEARTDIDPPLFANHSRVIWADSDRRLTPRSVQSMLMKYSKLAGLPHFASPHTLRHTYATDLLNQGVDLRTVQEFLGHKNIVTTQIYTHVTNKRLKDIHKKFHSGENLKN